MIDETIKEIPVACKKPTGEYTVPEFLTAIDEVFCTYTSWSTCEEEAHLADALEMYAKHKQEDYRP